MFLKFIGYWLLISIVITIGICRIIHLAKVAEIKRNK